MSRRRCEICSVSAKDRGGFFANFPLDENRCKEWVRVVGNLDLAYLPIEKLHQIRFICGDHFGKKDFNKKGTKLLKRAIPSLNLTAAPLTDEELEEFPLRPSRKPGACKDVKLASSASIQKTSFTVIPDHSYCMQPQSSTSQWELSHTSILIAQENSEIGNSQDVNLVSENQTTNSPEIENCETLKALPQIVDSCNLNEDSSQNNENLSHEIEDCQLSPQVLKEIVWDYDTTNDNLSIVIEESDVTQQTLPQDTPGCVTNNESENKEITTKEAPNKINNQWENKEITKKEAPNKLNNESENKEITNKEAPNKIYKVVSINDNLMLVEQNENDLQLDSANHEITTKEAPNKIYKVVSINDKLMLVEQNENDLQLDSANDNVDNLLKDGFLEDENPGEVAKQLTTEYNISAIDNEEATTVTDTSRVEGANSHAIPAKFNRKDRQTWTAMVLLHENKYKDIKTKLNIFIKIKKEYDVYKKETQRLRVLCNKLKLHVEELQHIKKCLHDSYSEAQIQLLTKRKKNKISWTNEDIKNAIYLYRIIPQAAYRYLKYHMKFPLPRPEVVKMWMTERNINFKARKNIKVTGTTVSKASNIQNIEANKFTVQNQETHEPNAEIQCYTHEYNIQNQDGHESVHQIPIQPCTTASSNPNSLTNEATETELAVEIIQRANDINNVSEEYYITHENCISNNDSNTIYVDQICAQDLTNVHNNEVYEDNAHYSISEEYVIAHDNCVSNNDNNTDNVVGVCAQNLTNVHNNEVYEDNAHYSISKDYVITHDNCVSNNDNNTDNVDGICAQNLTNVYNNEVYEDNAHYSISEDYIITHETCVSNNDNNTHNVEGIYAQSLTNVHNEVYEDNAHYSISEDYIITHDNCVSNNDNNTHNVEGIYAQNLTNVHNEVYEDNAPYSISEDYVISHDNCVSNNDNNTDNVDGICTQNLTNVHNNEVYEDNAHYSISEDYIQDSEMNGDGDNVQSVDVNDAPSSNNAHNNTNEGNACGITSEYSKWDLNVIQGFRKLKPNIKRNSSTCQLCKKPFDTEGELKQHVPAHYHSALYTTYLDAKTPFVCEFCNEQVPKRHSLVQHHVEHLGIEQFKCWHAGCTYVGRNKSCFWKHMAVHFPRTHSCPQCSATFKQRYALREHFARRHSARVKHRCALCGAVCRSDYTYYLHKMSHDKPPRFKCPAAGCSESFYSKSALFVHKRSHEEFAAVYQCPHCPLATFTQEFHLNRHLERHEKYQIAQCCKCQKIFDTYSEYYNHIKTDPHTQGKHICVCSESFKTKLKFKEHQEVCTLADKNDETTNTMVTEQNIKEVKKKVSVPEKLTVLSDSIEQSSIKIKDATVNQKENDQIPEATPEHNVTMTEKSHTQEPKSVAVLQSQESSTATNGNKNKNIIQGQIVDSSSEKTCQTIAVPSNLASNPQTITVKNISQLQNVIQILNKKKGKIFLPQQIFGSPEETNQRQSVAIKRTHDQQKDTVIPPHGGIKKFIQEQQKVVVSEETCQEKVLAMNQKDIVVPEAVLKQVIPARGIGATLKLGQVTPDNYNQNVILAQKVTQIPETGSQPKSAPKRLIINIPRQKK